MGDRWDWLEGLKPESAIIAAVKQMANLVAEELSSWPPAVRMTEGPGGSRFAEVVAPGATRPSRPAFEEALKRVRWELERDYDAIDHYERNHTLAKRCPDRADQIASEFIQHYILEAFYTLMEKTESRVKRKDVLVGIDALERKLDRALGRS